MKYFAHFFMMSVAIVILFYVIEITSIHLIEDKFSDIAIVFNISFFMGYVFSLIPGVHFLERSKFLKDLPKRGNYMVGIVSVLLIAGVCGAGVYGGLFLLFLFFFFSKKRDSGRMLV